MSKKFKLKFDDNINADDLVYLLEILYMGLILDEKIINHLPESVKRHFKEINVEEIKEKVAKLGTSMNQLIANLNSIMKNPQ